MNKKKLILIVTFILLSLICLFVIYNVYNKNNIKSNYISDFNEKFKQYEIKAKELKSDDVESYNLFIKDNVKTINEIKNEVNSKQFKYNSINDINKKINLVKNNINDKLISQSKKQYNETLSMLNDQSIQYNNNQTKQVNEYKNNLKKYQDIYLETKIKMINLYTNYKDILNVKKDVNLFIKNIKDDAIKEEKETDEQTPPTSNNNNDSNNSNYDNNSKECEPKYVKGILLVNKTFCLPASYNPGGLTSDTQAAWNKMVEGAKEDNINLYMQSGFRSYEYQVETYNYWVNLYGEEYADMVSAKPGHSEHQTGLTIDVSGDNGCTLDTCFISTPEGKWLEDNAHKYGFIIRYPKDKTNITGYNYEPWHIRYVGQSHAQQIKEKDITLEEYLGY